MKHYGSPKGTVSLVHELDVGQHLLLMMSDGSIDLLPHEEEPTPLLQLAASTWMQRRRIGSSSRSMNSFHTREIKS